MKTLRKILWPFSLLYGGVVKLRNCLYDWGICRSVAFGFPVICVGNLSVGGTGKTPMVEYLVRLLKNDFNTAVLSRGYRRKSKGFVLAGPGTGVEELGDEPCQYHEKFSDITVAVDANRVNGITRLSLQNPSPDVIVLDDAFQHRRVRAGLNILLTAYQALYTKDTFLPSGNLRDSRKEARRAAVIIVTKCPKDLGSDDRNRILRELAPEKGQQVFFTSIAYDEHIVSHNQTVPLKDWEKKGFTLVTGIANPDPLVGFLEDRELAFEHLAYPDHHHFTAAELKMLGTREHILTTEKDFMRLKDRLDGIFFLGIRPVFLFDGEKVFDRLIRDYIMGKKPV